MKSSSCQRGTACNGVVRGKPLETQLAAELSDHGGGGQTRRWQEGGNLHARVRPPGVCHELECKWSWMCAACSAVSHTSTLRVGALGPERGATVTARSGGPCCICNAYSPVHSLAGLLLLPVLLLQNRRDQKFRLAVGSFLEDYNNKVEIITRMFTLHSCAPACTD